MITNELSPDFWKRESGFFPHSLFQKRFQHEKFILLNGKGGNFCIDYNDENPKKCRSYAWSSNVSHYLTVKGDVLKIFRWDKHEPTDILSVRRVADKLSTFNNYLLQQRIHEPNNCVNVSLGIYRQIRSSLRDKTGLHSLNVLLCAFAEAKKGSKLLKKDIDFWGIDSDSLARAHSIRNWSSILETLSNDIPSLGITPEIELILRHASGKIFQDAHYDAYFPSQLTFDFFEYNNLTLKKSTGNYTAHYTPTSIVRSIVEETYKNYDFSSKKEIIILDPAVGSGEFLKEALRQLNLRNYEGKIKLIGWDTSSTAVQLANFSLHFERQACNKPNNVLIEINVHNALTKSNNWSIKADFIFMNPPFISWEQLSKSDRERIENILESNFKIKPNMAGAFLWKATNSLNIDGKLGCILPNSILEANSFYNLRETINEIIQIDFIGKLGSLVIFEDAISSTSILIGVNKKSANETQLMWSDKSEDGYASALRALRKMSTIMPNNKTFTLPGTNFNFYPIENLVSKNWIPIDLSAFQLVNQKLKSMTKVKDIFDVKQGVRTGLNNVFLISKADLKKLPKSEHKYFRPAVTNDSIKFGNLEDLNYIFYAEGSYSIENEKELKNVVPTFYSQILLPNKTSLVSRARKDASNFWRLSEHRSWQIKPTPKIVSTEFGLAGSFAFDIKGIFVSERSHAWLPKITAGFEEIGYGYVAILTMPIINNLLKGLSKEIRSGSYYLSSQYISEMPIPNLYNKSIEIKTRHKLISLGRQLSNGEYNSEIHIELESLTSNVFKGE